MDPVSITDEVREFYQRHPYPPPVEGLDRYRERWNDTQRRRADFHLFEPDKPYCDDRSILVAGCGTSQAAKYAVRWPNAKITGIDISRTSIEQTERLKREYKLDNLEVLELPVERATELDCRFDHVVCTGVLHHLPNPDKGLRALRDVLDPEGSLHLMVYAPYGRAGIYLLQDYCRRLGIGTSTKEIRDLATSLGALPSDHPLVPLLRNSPDFRNEAALADALLHPQDRSYSVDQFFEFLNRADLQFGRWIRQAPYLPQCGGLTQIPHSGLMGRLTLQEQFAAVELFRGNMLRHSAVVYHADLPEPAQAIDFDGDGWLDHIPIPVSGTVVVEERLPAGAAAVLINRAHTQTDIYLPIDTNQKRLFDTIDGERSIRDLVGDRGDLSATCALFERLWQYDQVVFDTSKQSSRSGADAPQQNPSTSNDR
jgi:SAM-dependent methyltransferase